MVGGDEGEQATSVQTPMPLCVERGRGQPQAGTTSSTRKERAALINNGMLKTDASMDENSKTPR